MINTTKILKIKDYSGFIQMNSNAAGVFFLYCPIIEDYSFTRYPYAINVNYIHHCREVLAEREIKPDEYVGFHVVGLNDKLDLFIKFWEEIEENMPEKSEIYRTSFKDAIILKINSFWGSSRTRRQFFSLFLRAGAVYHKEGKSIEQTLTAYSLSNLTLPACQLFIEGYTVNPRDNEINWNSKGLFETFKMRDKNSIVFSKNLMKIGQA